MGEEVTWDLKDDHLMHCVRILDGNKGERFATPFFCLKCRKYYCSKCGEVAPQSYQVASKLVRAMRANLFNIDPHDHDARFVRGHRVVE